MAFNPHNRPDVYVLDGSAKGLTFEKLLSMQDVSAIDGRKKDASVMKLYSHQGWFKRCVDVIGLSLAGMPFGVYRPGAEEPLFTNQDQMPPELEWLDLHDWLFRAGVSLELAGAAYSMKEYTGARVSNVIWWNPETVTPIYTGEGIKHFERYVNSRRFEIDPELVIRVFSPDPFVEQGPGGSDGKAARMSAQILYDLDTFTSDQLRSGLPKKTILVADSSTRPPDDKEKNRILHSIQRFFQGNKAAMNEIMVGIKPEQIGSDLTDLAENAITETQQASIATSLGVPHSMVASSAANYATAKADQVNFYTTKIVPTGRMVAQALNRHLFSAFGVEMRFEPGRLEVFQQHELEKAQQLMELTGGRPVYTRQMAANALGVTYTPADLEELERADQMLFARVGVDTTATPDQAKKVDLDRWRKAVKNRGYDYDFSPDALSDSEAGVIRERLAMKMPLDEVFSPPFVGF